MERVSTLPIDRDVRTDSFEDFFRRTYVRLAQAVFLLLRNESDAEDVAQEAFARIYERWDRVRGMESADGYLYRTALNLVRRRARKRPAPAAMADSEVSPDPAGELARREQILTALATLSRSHREAIVLVDWLGMTNEEAAQLLKLEASSVRVRLHRARGQLRRILEENHE